MKQRAKFTIKQEQELEQAAELQAGQKSIHEFNSVEELLRHDAEQTTLPPTIAQRLSETIQKSEPPPPRSWWRRLLE